MDKKQYILDVLNGIEIPEDTNLIYLLQSWNQLKSTYSQYDINTVLKEFEHSILRDEHNTRLPFHPESEEIYRNIYSIYKRFISTPSKQRGYTLGNSRYQIIKDNLRFDYVRSVIKYDYIFNGQISQGFNTQILLNNNIFFTKPEKLHITDDNKMFIWDLNTNKKDIINYETIPFDTVLNFKGNLIYVLNNSSALYHGKNVFKFPVDKNSFIKKAQIINNTDLLGVTFNTGDIYVLDLNNWKIKTHIIASSRFFGAVFLEDQIIIVYPNNHFEFWKGEQLTHEIGKFEGSQISTFMQTIDDQRLLITYTDGTITILNYTTKEIEKTIQTGLSIMNVSLRNNILVSFENNWDNTCKVYVFNIKDLSYKILPMRSKILKLFILPNDNIFIVRNIAPYSRKNILIIDKDVNIIFDKVIDIIDIFVSPKDKFFGITKDDLLCYIE